ncbi:MAG: hypothetical protein ABH863_04255 [Candidatus Micrarchaeota archaeon]
MPIARMDEWAEGAGQNRKNHFSIKIGYGVAHPDVRKELLAISTGRRKKYTLRAIEKAAMFASLGMPAAAIAGTGMRHRANEKNSQIMVSLNTIAQRLKTGELLNPKLHGREAEEGRIFALLKKHSLLHPHFYVRTLGKKLIITSKPSEKRLQALTHLRGIARPQRPVL